MKPFNIAFVPSIHSVSPWFYYVLKHASYITTTHLGIEIDTDIYGRKLIVSSYQ